MGQGRLELLLVAQLPGHWPENLSVPDKHGFFNGPKMAHVRDHSATPVGQQTQCMLRVLHVHQIGITSQANPLSGFRIANQVKGTHLEASKSVLAAVPNPARL